MDFTEKTVYEFSLMAEKLVAMGVDTNGNVKMSFDVDSPIGNWKVTFHAEMPEE